MANVLGREKREQVLALGRLGWSLRRIQAETGVHRETASAYLKAAGIAIRGPGRWGRPASKTGQADVHRLGGPESKPAKRRPPTRAWPPVPGRSPQASACEPYREWIEAGVRQGRTAMSIWQDLVDDHGFPSSYASVKRFVVKLRDEAPRDAHPVIETAPGEEGQVDYGDGPMVRHPASGKYRRTRMFVFTLGYSRKSVRLLGVEVEQPGLVGAAREGLPPSRGRAAGGRARQPEGGRAQARRLRRSAQPALSRRARALRRHGAAVPGAASRSQGEGRVGGAPRPAEGAGSALRVDRRGADLSRPLGARRWADTRIHGTTKRQVAAMYAEEKPHLLPLPVEPFRYYAHGERTVHLDGAVEIEGAYYHAPPGWLGRRVAVQWDALRVRLIDPRTGELLREHVRQKRGKRRMREEDRPKRTPATTLQLLARAERAGRARGRRLPGHPPPGRRARCASHPGRALAVQASRHHAGR